MLTHVVMFKFKDRTHELVDEMVSRLMALDGAVPALRRLVVGADVVRSARSYDLALIADFDDEAGLDEYMTHPAHQAVLVFINQVMEPRLVVDFIS